MIYLFVAIFLVVKANCLFYDTKNRLEIQVDEMREEGQTIQLTDLVKNKRNDIKQTAELVEIRKSLQKLQILMPISTALLAGICCSLFRGCSLSMKVNNGNFVSLTSYTFVTIAVLGSLIYVKLFNNTIHLFDQIDTVPIYESSLIIINILAGAFVLQESAKFTWEQVY